MAIRLHNFIISQTRYIQVESQPHHIAGIFQAITRSLSLRHCEFTEIHSAYYECEEDGTMTFYQAKKTDTGNPGIWTYLVYECPEGQEKVFRDAFIETSSSRLQELLTGKKLPQITGDIHEYLKCKDNESEYLDVQLPDDWNSQEGRVIAHLILEEFKALKSSSVFAETAGKQYMQAVLDNFIAAAQEILETNGTAAEFEALQDDILKRISTHDIANLIIDRNDYRIWQAALPSKSKAVEYAFNVALALICRIK
ncbi:MAG: hypothetical protein HEQ35_12090 [Gloeotrichia echinulata IR180]|nr:hypothetical protein [Gloeotrichia echinulata DEX184]